ncbi:MAG: thiol oxidoreductase [Hyphomicrobiales bacterium]|nr:c-type cytochrome [Hyphomicrobiales bacterium]PCH49770.1 MAG: thiol oxidoreductase [Hyphomicrobiales bacterium]
MRKIIQNKNGLLSLLITLPLISAISTTSFSQNIIIRDDLSPKDLKRVAKIIEPTNDFAKAENFENMQGGAGTTLRKPSRDSFSQSSTNITFKEERDFKLGNALFRKLWVSSPASTKASDGLGPLFNARACQTCHIKDGRGHPPEGDLDQTSMFFRLAKTPETQEEIKSLENYITTVIPDPIYGGQLQDAAVPGLAGEGRMKITYAEKKIKYVDGSTATLRAPSYEAVNLAYGPLNAKTTLSPRVTPQMIGLGLLEAIHESDLRALADEDDKNGDGISGKLAIVRDNAGKKTVGRFGWKATNASIRQQSAGAFSGDIGISSPDVPGNYGDCTKYQKACLNMPHGEQAKLGIGEAPEEVLSLVTFYSQNLAVPIRRNSEDVNVLRGKKHFYELGCISCHTPKFVTSRKAGNKAQRFQLIWPYTDLLLHDMGDGLADGQAVGVANGKEWRTPPLWGIGLTKTVSGHTFYLHDGRARNLTEAILWHGGEAENSMQGFSALNKEARENLVQFLRSL